MNRARLSPVAKAIVTVRYSDEASVREVFAPADYINISDVRRRGAVLYVLRSITLFRVEYRLAVYDLNSRARLTDRRVDVNDVKGRHGIAEQQYPSLPRRD